MKQLKFLGDSIKRLRDFPTAARQDAGYQLDRVQRGEKPADCKSMPSIGKGVEEIRLWSERGTYRVIYTARICGAVYVLMSFRKRQRRHRSRISSLQDCATAN